MLSRSFMPPEEASKMLAYTPMFHSRLFTERTKIVEDHFQPVKKTKDATTGEIKQEIWLDGNPAIDRPLFVQFCANDPDILLEAAKIVAPYCDAVDLNLGCPQGIARKGNYGAFLQEDQDLIYRLVNKLHRELPIPVTAKMRVLDTNERTLAYAKNLLAAGASIITVHGRQRHMKGHYTGLADWTKIKYLRDNLPPDTVMFANGNVLQHSDIQRCLDATGADGIMSAEGNLHDPAILAPAPPPGQEGREYWRGQDGKGGWRIDAVTRRYLDIIYKHVMGVEPPPREALFIPSDIPDQLKVEEAEEEKPETNGQGAAGLKRSAPEEMVEDEPQTKKQKRKKNRDQSKADKRATGQRGPNFHAMQAHMFGLLRPLIGTHTHIRDALSRCKGGNMPSFEGVLSMIEKVTKEGLIEYARTHPASEEQPSVEEEEEVVDDPDSSVLARSRCARPFWICQPHLRPMPAEAISRGLLKVKGTTEEELQEIKRAAALDTKPSNGLSSQKEKTAKVEEEITNNNVQRQMDSAVSG